MRCLLVINSLGSGGAEKLVVDTLIEYEKKGLKTDLFLLNCSKTHFYEKLTTRTNIEIISASNYSVYNPIHIYRLLWVIPKYDVIHVHLFPALYWVGLAKILSFSRKPFIYTEHNTSNRRRNIKFIKFLDTIIYKQYTSIITISNSVDKNLREYLGRRFGNIKKIYNGIDLDEIKQASAYSKCELNLDVNKLYILQVASFTPQKDQETLIRCIPLLDNSFHLLLVGDGPTKDKCMVLVKDLNIEHRVQFLGIRKDVPRLLKTVDFIVLASHFEGLSLASVEGLASGKPFLASDVPGLREVVIDAGLLFPDGDYTKLAGLINLLFKDKEFYEQTVKNCINRAKQFDIKIMLNQYIDVYRNGLH